MAHDNDCETGGSKCCDGPRPSADDGKDDDEIPVLNLSEPVQDAHDASGADAAATSGADATGGQSPSQQQQQPGDAETAAPPPTTREQLDAERARADGYEQRLKLALADYQNLSRRTASDIEAGIMKKTAEVMTDMITIRDDFARARETFAKDGADTSGLDSILKNMDSALARHGVTPIDALGEIFDPAMHEAVSTEVDGTLDEGTITREVRRGYALKNTIIKPSMVVISKKE